jgi:hypothetical protein
MELSSSLLKLLSCPATGGPLEYDRVRNVLISKKANLEYPVRDGIPMLLISEAKKISTTEIKK